MATTTPPTTPGATSTATKPSSCADTIQRATTNNDNVHDDSTTTTTTKATTNQERVSSSDDNDGWYHVYMDVDKSKFFDPRYAVLEGDIQQRVMVNQQELLLKKGERCFVMVRQNVHELFHAMVPSSIAEERRSKGKPYTTGWLRHELFGLQVVVKLPLGNAKDYLTHNKRGIKCLDLPGEFVTIVDPNNSTAATASSTDDAVSSPSTSPLLFSADQEDLLTIQQSELKDRLTRHLHFAKWLVQMFGMDRLNEGSGVLDVAGGNGKLSLALHKLGITKCTILDPKPIFGEPRLGIDIVAEPLVGDGSALLTATTTTATAERIRNCSIVVGLHPDEATEALVDLALRLGKPFAVLPCCVMTKVFPHRTLRGGDPVRTVHALCRYLLEKTPNVEVDFLPFAGRNKVLYWKGPLSSSSSSSSAEPNSAAAGETLYCLEVGKNAPTTMGPSIQDETTTDSTRVS